jgi:hypothetical protein
MHAEPNPYSPFADADPKLRHIFPVPIFFPEPRPGVLQPTGCDRMAVVSPVPVEVPADLPDGLCPLCVAVMRGEEPTLVERLVEECRECGTLTSHDGLCALCRQEMHEQWWPTRPASEVS